MNLEDFRQAYAPMGGDAVEAEALVDGVLLNPRCPPDGSTPHLHRPIRELLAWWRLPYIVGQGDAFEVRCLDGGANDRPTHIGHAATAAEAARLARAYSPTTISVMIHKSALPEGMDHA